MEVKNAITDMTSNEASTRESDQFDQEESIEHPAETNYPEPNDSNYNNFTLDMFAGSTGVELDEITGFNRWRDAVIHAGCYTFEVPRLHAQKTEVLIERENHEQLKVLNFSSYNYLGYGYHPEVIAAAKQALDQYGLGAGASPVANGTLMLHKQFEQQLYDFIGLEDRGVSLFSSGYGANLGAISAYIKPGNHVVLDQSSHMSLIEGAILARAKISYFRHNDMTHLEKVLKRLANGKSRILICTEGVYSADGDFGNIRGVVSLAKKYHASVLVDEAHSMLVAGPNGKGACEEQGMLGDVDLLVMTFSKSFAGVGGCVVAKKEVAQYINFYGKCRMFSCALDPAVTGGMMKSLELASGEDGAKKRRKIRENADYFRELLRGKVNIGASESWVIPVIYGSEKLTSPLNNELQRAGIDTSIMQYPAAPRHQARIRLFVTSEHTHEQIERATQIIVDAARKFDFYTGTV